MRIYEYLGVLFDGQRQVLFSASRYCSRCVGFHRGRRNYFSFLFFSPSPSPPMRDANVFAFRRAMPRMVRSNIQRVIFIKLNDAELGQS